jgi:tetratricopeptide (TPR) repeat protein
MILLRPSLASAMVAAAMTLCLASAAQAAPIKGLTAGDKVASAYDAILSGKFDEWSSIATATCPPAPVTACQVLELAALWWQIQIDPGNRQHDGHFLERTNSAVAAVETWTAREPQRAEAWFYRGAAYGVRAQWRVLRKKRLAAAQDGKRIKNALERALKLDPDLHDAWFGIGLYHYYADVAPTAAKLLRFLLLLPGGDRNQGLKEMQRARNNGAVLRGEIDYQLHLLDLWYEKNPLHALRLLDGLKRQYPTNPHFTQTIAEVQETYLQDIPASLGTWRELADAARSGRVRQRGHALAVARLGIARQLDRLFDTDLAITELRELIASGPTAPAGVLARAQLQLGDALSRMGSRAEADNAYRAVLASAPPKDDALLARARAALKARPLNEQTDAYRASLTGWRALERGDLTTASSLIGQSVTLRPDDPVFRYREARLLIAVNDPVAAAASLARVLAARPANAPTIYAAACIESAVLAEQKGERERAITLYRRAENIFGADARVVANARRGRERLRTP